MRIPFSSFRGYKQQEKKYDSHLELPTTAIGPNLNCAFFILISFIEMEGFPGSSAGKKSAHNAGDPGLIPGSGRCPGEGKVYPFQYSGLENSMDCIVHGLQRAGHD